MLHILLCSGPKYGPVAGGYGQKFTITLRFTKNHTYRSQNWFSVPGEKFVPEDRRLRPHYFRNPERRMTEPLLSSICTSKKVDKQATSSLYSLSLCESQFVEIKLIKLIFRIYYLPYRRTYRRRIRNNFLSKYP